MNSESVSVSDRQSSLFPLPKINKCFKIYIKNIKTIKTLHYRDN